MYLYPANLNVVALLTAPQGSPSHRERELSRRLRIFHDPRSWQWLVSVSTRYRINVPMAPLPGRTELRHSVESISSGPNEQIHLLLGGAFREVPQDFPIVTQEPRKVDPPGLQCT